MEIRMVGLDLDGTVFDDHKVISARTLAAIEAAVQKGVVVLPATGRPLNGVPQQFLEIPGIRYALTSNGARVVEIAANRTVCSLPMDRADALAVYHLLRTVDCSLDIFADGQSFSTARDLEYALARAAENLRAYLRASRNVVPDLEAFLAQSPYPIEKITLFFQDRAQRDAAQARVQASTRLECTSSFENNLELNAPGVNKGRGLLQLAAQLGFGPEQVMACGDSSNDLEMIRMAGFGVAMANSEPEVLAAANYVTLSNNADGVADVLEKFVL